MKSMYILLFFSLILTLVSCFGGETSTENNEKPAETIKDNPYKLNLSSCNDEALSNCLSTNDKANALQLEDSIFGNNQEELIPLLCSSNSLSVDNLNKIIKNDRYLITSESQYTFTTSKVDDTEIKKLTIFDYSVVSQNKQNLDILYDLTYYTSTNNNFRKDDSYNARVFNRRKEQLKQYLINQNLQYGDSIRVTYLGSENPLFTGDSQEGIISTTSLVFDQANIYTINKGKSTIELTSWCDEDSYRRNKTLYYHIDKTSTTDLITERNGIISEILSKIDEYYNSGTYSRASFFLETFYKDTKILNNTNTTKTAIFSNFKFFLHPEMKLQNGIPMQSYVAKFPPDDISNYTNKSTNYSKLYKEYIPKNYLQERCKHNENVALFGISFDDDIEKQRVMKDYFQNYFFKGCKVEIQ